VFFKSHFDPFSIAYIAKLHLEFSLKLLSFLKNNVSLHHPGATNCPNIRCFDLKSIGNPANLVIPAKRAGCAKLARLLNLTRKNRLLSSWRAAIAVVCAYWLAPAARLSCAIPASPIPARMAVYRFAKPFASRNRYLLTQEAENEKISRGATR
jgi:hypothetical protein